MILFRHGSCDTNNYNANPGLSKTGQMEVLNWATRLNIKVEQIYSSPKKRALESSQIIYSFLNPENFNIINKLREIHPDALKISCHQNFPDKKRAENVLQLCVVKKIFREDLIIVSHRNLLHYCFCRIFELSFESKNYFANFGSSMELGIRQDEFFWRPLLVC